MPPWYKNPEFKIKLGLSKGKGKPRVQRKEEDRKPEAAKGPELGKILASPDDEAEVAYVGGKPPPAKRPRPPHFGEEN